MTITQVIALIVICLITIFYVSWKVYKQGLKDVAISLILQAEKSISSGNGKEKFKMVVGGITAKLPFPFNLIPVPVIEELVQSTFDTVKDLLDYRGEE